MATDHPALTLLDQIHGAILTADFARLTELTPALETSLTEVSLVSNTQVLARIKAKADRNAACLLASGRGVRAAQRRLAEMRSASTGFSTYDGRGRRALHGLPSSFARRF